MSHVTFIHGIANKPDKDFLLRIWRDSLARDEGLDLGAEGVTSQMVYWADVLYEEPKAAMAEHEANDSIVAKGDPDIDMDWRARVPAEQRSWTDGLAAKLDFEAPPPEDDEDYQPPEEAIDIAFERVPLPWWLKRRLMEVFLRDVHHYLFDAEHTPRPGETYPVREEIRGRTLDALRAGAERARPHVVVSHSMGTVIAYDCLKRVEACPPVDALITIGSPLGLDEIQDQLGSEDEGTPGWTREHGFPAEKVRSEWVNVYDALDPVAGFDPALSNDFQFGGTGRVEDIHEPSYGRWRHNISKYLGGRQLRARLERLLEL